MIALIEYDKTVYYLDNYDEPPEVPAPFGDKTDTYCLSDNGWLYTGSKGYLFFSAVAGVRGDGVTRPLYEPRGLPPNPSLALLRLVEEGEFDGWFAAGWLTPREIRAALRHQNVDPDLLGFETLVLLELLDNLERRLGEDRVRLVFAFA